MTPGNGVSDFMAGGFGLELAPECVGKLVEGGAVDPGEFEVVGLANLGVEIVRLSA